MVSTTLVVFVLATCLWVSSSLWKRFNSPLSRIPNAHFSAPFSRLWLIWNRYWGTEVTSCHEAHRLLGPLVRTGPNEVSVNCIEGGVQVAYSTNWDKADMYANFVNYGHPPLFSILEGKPHAERKRIYSHVYSKSTIDNSTELKEIFNSVNQVLSQKLKAWSKDSHTVNVLPLSESYSMDAITAYLYGRANATKWLQDDEQASLYLPAFQTVLEPNVFFLFTELPNVLHFAERIGINLIPNKVLSALEIVLPYAHKLTKQAVTDVENKTSEQHGAAPAILHIRNKVAESKVPEDQRLDIMASDLLDQIHAAHEATGIVLTFAMWELTKSPKIQSALRDELRALSTAGQSPLQSTLLEDVLLETSRLYPAAFGPFPRSAPQGAKLAGFDIPAGTIVSASPFILGRDAEVFPDPERWNPYRWSSASKGQRTKMKKWVWMFTSGSRMCLGEHLAVLTMKAFIASVYQDYRTVLAEESNMKQLETFIALPTDASLFLSFHTA